MYERSAIVLERYVEKLLQLDKEYNLKTNCKNYMELIEEIEEYEIIATKEGKIIEEFDNMAQKIEGLQKEQEKMYHSNVKLEETRNKLFKDLGENSTTLEKNFIKVENLIDKNNEELKKIREQYLTYLIDFAERQTERNKCERDKRLGETKHVQFIKDIAEQLKTITPKDILELKEFINSDKAKLEEEVTEIMLKNGKNEKVGFNKDVIKLAIKTRMDIAEKEAECYLIIFERTRKLLAELENEEIKIVKYKKALRDISVKLSFLNAEKEYIVGLLDYERMTAISGEKAHSKLMEEACNNFELDIDQINNLYELVIRETTNKATKKAYKELYNKTYLKNIEDKEKNFEQEVNSIKINMGTVINSNYWRIEGIKNIYDVFNNEVTEKFEKDLSEFRIEEVEEPKEEKIEELYGLSDIYDFDDDYEDEYDKYDEYDDNDDNDDDYEDDYEDEDDEIDEYDNDEDDFEDDEEDEYSDDDEYEDDEFDEDYEEDDDFEDDYEDEDYETDEEDKKIDNNDIDDEKERKSKYKYKFQYYDDDYGYDEYNSDEDDDYERNTENEETIDEEVEEKKGNIFNKLFKDKKDKKTKTEKNAKKEKKAAKKK